MRALSCSTLLVADPLLQETPLRHQFWRRFRPLVKPFSFFNAIICNLKHCTFYWDLHAACWRDLPRALPLEPESLRSSQLREEGRPAGLSKLVLRLRAASVSEPSRQASRCATPPCHKERERDACCTKQRLVRQGGPNEPSGLSVRKATGDGD